MRVGHGIDFHRFKEGSFITLGGVRIPHSKALDGHSDADVLTHAIMDAILGALGLPDIGELFPNTDPKFKGANSIELLKEVLKLASGYRVVNADCVLVLESPRIATFKKDIINNLSTALDAESVGLKATTSEGLGAIGRGEGVMASVTVLLSKLAK
jgi:2-C-methyl-D-erythritol 2,4-cyclodiphosphate synthase